MKCDNERELWLLKLTDEKAANAEQSSSAIECDELKELDARRKVIRWGFVAVAGLTAASLAAGS